MYGETLPYTGSAGLALFGSAFGGIWLVLGLVTALAVLFAVARMIPRKEF